MATNNHELKELLASTEWRHLGEGLFNRVFCSTDALTINGHRHHWVMKIPHTAHPFSESARAVRIWNKVNRNYPAIQIDQKWLVPYLGDIQASDEQIANKLIDIYRRHQIIIADACTPGRFLVHGGRVICVGFGMASRRGSGIYDRYRFYNDPVHHNYLEEMASEGFPLTSRIIDALGYWEKQFLDHMYKDCITLSLLLRLTPYSQRNDNMSVAEMDSLLAQDAEELGSFAATSGAS